MTYDAPVVEAGGRCYIDDDPHFLPQLLSEIGVLDT